MRSTSINPPPVPVQTLPVDSNSLALLEQTVEAVWLLGVDDCLVYVTDKAEQYYRHTPDEMLGKTLADLEFFDTQDICTEEYIAAITMRQPFSSDRFILRYQHRIPNVVRLVGYPIYNEQGTYAGYFSSAVDMGSGGLTSYIRDELSRLSQGKTVTPQQELDLIARVIHETLGLDAIVISSVQGSKMDVLSFYHASQARATLSLDSHNTPCEITLKQGHCYIEDDLATRFPQQALPIDASTYLGHRLNNPQGKAIGLLCAYHTKPLQPAELVKEVFESVGALAAPFLSHYLDNKRVNDQNLALNQAYRLAKVGAWLNYPGRGVNPYWSAETYDVWGEDKSSKPNLRKMFQQVHSDDRDRVYYHWNNLKTLGNYTLEYRITDREGRLKWLLESAETEYDAEGNYKRVVGVIQDISAQKRNEEQLRTMAHAVFESSNIVYSLDLKAKVVDCNPAFEECTGYSREEVLGQSGTILNMPDTPRALYWGLWRQLLSGQEWRGETENKRRSGEPYWAKTVITPVRNTHGEIISYLCVQEDITEKKQQEAMLRHQAYHDGLTGLPNRLQVQEQLSNLLDKHEPVSLLFIDLDGFKHVNDSMGHQVGDGLLQRVAKRLQATVRNADMLARLGGDEFVVVLESNSQAELTAERILKVLSHPFEVAGRIMHLGASIGIVSAPDDGDSADVLMRNADAAMYHAKSNGKNTYCVFSNDIYRDSARRMQLEIGLRHALHRQELSLHYQAQQLLETGKVLGAEALCRWHSKELGNVSPEEFIPLAEEIGLIDDIGAWVVGEALRNCRLWRDNGSPDAIVSINVSPRQFRSESLLSTIADALAKYQLPASALCVEVTETLLVDSYDQAQAMLSSLQALGVFLAIDDFGVGYSSLSYLKRFPFDTLKIDRSFIRDMETNEDDYTLVRTIIQLAHNLGLKVVAEGVEKKAHQELLSVIGCDAIQGYWLSRPVSADTFVEMMSEAVEA
jgi:diguanylate cyclase (GGDEF)-like protein/PAS domain S-box-containing protein